MYTNRVDVLAKSHESLIWFRSSRILTAPSRSKLDQRRVTERVFGASVRGNRSVMPAPYSADIATCQLGKVARKRQSSAPPPTISAALTSMMNELYGSQVSLPYER